MKKSRKDFSFESVSAGLFLMSVFYFSMLSFKLIFIDGENAWEYFGKGIGLQFVGLIMLGFAGPKVKKSPATRRS